MKIPRLIIAGATSGVGKTTITCAIIKELRNKGLSVSPFKVGPDYIDPIYLSAAAQNPAHNLDSWLMGSKNQLLTRFATHSNKDVSIIEGVMGYYDGYDGTSDLASTYQIASITRSPVILIIDASKTARSVAAIATGFQTLKKDSRIVGVILNRLGSDRHEFLCRDALYAAEIPLLGSIHRNESIQLEERHLGLHSTMDSVVLEKRLQNITKSISSGLCMNEISDIMCSARDLSSSLSKLVQAGKTHHNSGKVNRAMSQSHSAADLKQKLRTTQKTKGKKPVIAVALDNSFNFYYQDNLDALRREGADLVFFSPVSDKQLPPCDGVYIGGGFPEILAEPLERNESMKESIKRAAEDETPIYAECGGLMYLSQDIKSLKGKKHKMVGLFDVSVVMTKKPVLHYTSGFIDSYTPITGARGRTFKGHEFHYSRITNIARDARFAMMLNYDDDDYDDNMSLNSGIREAEDGIMIYNTLAAYGHLYFDVSAFALMFVTNCMTYKRC